MIFTLQQTLAKGETGHVRMGSASKTELQLKNLKGREHSVDTDEIGWIILKRITNKYDGSAGTELIRHIVVIISEFRFKKKEKCLNFGFHEIPIIYVTI